MFNIWFRVLKIVLNEAPRPENNNKHDEYFNLVLSVSFRNNRKALLFHFLHYGILKISIFLICAGDEATNFTIFTEY